MYASAIPPIHVSYVASISAGVIVTIYVAAIVSKPTPDIAPNHVPIITPITYVSSQINRGPSHG